MSSCTISVIIVTATGSRWHVERCLAALNAASVPRVRLEPVVVDNASTDDLVGFVRSRFPDVPVHALTDNRGFAAGVNHGIRATAGEFVLLLNPDAVASGEAISRLQARLQADPGLAAVGPRLLDSAGRADHNAKRSFPTPAAALAHFLAAVHPSLRDRGGYGRVDLEDEAVAEVEAISGSCMLVRRAAIEDVGLLDEGYWMYGEDLDWCRRIGLRGWRILYVGDAVVLHVKHGVSGARRGLRLEWSFHRAMGRFYRRYDGGANRALDVLVYVGVLARFVSVLLCATVRQHDAIRQPWASRRTSQPSRTASKRRTPSRAVTSTTATP